jgi:acetyl esterase
VALDEATAALLEAMAALGEPPSPGQTPERAREIRTAEFEQIPPGPIVAVVRDTSVPVSGGDVPLRILIPKLPGDGPRGVIVWYHGGGWVTGGLNDAEPVGRTLAQRTGCTVVIVDYRLAPEYRFPTAVDDSWTALNWAAERLPELVDGPVADPGIEDPGPAVPLIVAGDSAGGNLAAVMAQRAKTAGGPDITAQILVYPVTDCDLDAPAYLDPENQLTLPRETMTWYWDHYLPVPEHRLHPDASPLRAPDLTGLPPAVVVTAEHDVLRDEGEAYATRLLKADVPVRLLRCAGQAHGFFSRVGLFPAAAPAIDSAADALDELLPAPAPAAPPGVL